MLSLLNGRENGLSDPYILRRAESTRRATSLELSKHRDVAPVHASSVNSLDLDLIENRYLLSGATDGRAVIHDLENHTGEVKFTSSCVCSVGLSNKHRHKHSIETVLWYPLDTGLFTTSGTDRLLKVWDTNTLVPAEEFEFSGIVYSHHMSPVATKHCLIAVGTQSSTVKLVDLKSGSSSHTLKGHKDSVLCVRWSTRNEFLVASGSADSKIQLWDIRSAKGCLMILDRFNGRRHSKRESGGAITSHNGSVNGLQFSSDGLGLVSYGSDHKIQLWNTNTGKNTLVNYGKVENDSQRAVKFAISQCAMTDIIYMPNGCDIDVFEMLGGYKLDTLRGHYTHVNCCVCHPDYQDLYSGGSDRNILTWVPRGDTAYDDHLKQQNKGERKSNVGKITVLTADTWSSDEES